MRCSQCHSENPDDGKFCTQCGSSLARRCPGCGSQVELDGKFCGQCGRDLSPAAQAPTPAPGIAPRIPDQPGERRYASVLFSDLSGYAAMNELLDPEEVQAFMSRFKSEAVRIVESHDGSVNQFVGDEVLALFGIPTAHKDDPVRAVQAALELHEMVRRIATDLEPRLGRRLRLHSGICSGLIVTHVADEREGRVGITGDTVNTGARLKAMAEEDAILIAPETGRAVAEHFALTTLLPVVLKGKEAAITPYRVQGVVPDQPAQARRPFVGRQGELRQIEGVIQALLEAHAGRVVAIRGDPGIGKSRLAAAASESAQRNGLSCHRAEVLDFGAGRSQNPVRALVFDLLGIDPIAGAETRGAAVCAALAQGRLDRGHEAFLLDWLDLTQPDDMRASYSAMDHDYRNRQKRETVSSLLRHAAEAAPRLLLVEDVHWADRSMLADLAELAAVTLDSPVLLLLTTRVTGDPLDAAWRQSARGAAVTTIDVPALGVEAARQLAQSFPDIPAQVAEQCIARASGNPLFLERLLVNAEEGAGGTLPGSVQSIVLAQMDQLTAEHKAALQAASVLGQRFDADAVRAILSVPGYDFSDLAAHALVRREGHDHLFAHALIRDGVYESILLGVRRGLHARAAEWYRNRDPVARAEHLERAADPAAARAYLEAAQAESVRLRFESALALVERGLALAQVDELRFDLRQAQGRVLLDLGATEAALDAYRAATELAQDEMRRCRSLLGVGTALRLADRYADALQALDQARALAAAHGADAELADVYHMQGNIAFLRGDVGQCLNLAQQALQFARAAGSTDREARSVGALGDGLYVQGRVVSAFEQFRRCIELCRAHGLRRIEAEHRGLAGCMRLFKNDAPGALADAEAALQIAEEVGQLRAQPVSHRCLWVILFETGAFARARRHAEQGLAIAQRLNSRSMEAGALHYIAVTHLAEGNADVGWPALLQALEMSRQTGMGLDGAWILGSVALYATQAEQRDAAIAEGLDLLCKGAVSHNYLYFHRLAIRAALRAREWERAREFANALDRYTASEPIPMFDLVIAAGRDLANLGTGARAPDVVDRLRALRARANASGLVLLGREFDEAMRDIGGAPALLE